jgi:hypothetical protein
MIRLFANPFIVAAVSRRRAHTHQTPCTLSREPRGTINRHVRSSRRQKCSAFRRDVSFHIAKQQPLDRSILRCCPSLPHAHIRVARGSAPNDEASRPDEANHLPGHPASSVRSVRTVGSPQSCSGARYRCSSISGRFLPGNLVGLGPQSKWFFWYLDCEGVMANAARSGPGPHLTDRA